jgi:hypothetical protein
MWDGTKWEAKALAAYTPIQFSTAIGTTTQDFSVDSATITPTWDTIQPKPAVFEPKAPISTTCENRISQDDAIRAINGSYIQLRGSNK